MLERTSETLPRLSVCSALRLLLSTSVNRFCVSAALSIFCASSGACGRQSDAATAHLMPNVMADLAGPVFHDVAGSNCNTATYVRIRRPPSDRLVSVRGCFQTTADTDRYVYRDPAGRIVVAGLYLRVEPDRLHAVIDSLHQVLAGRFGPSTECKENRTTFGPMYAWDLDSVAVSLWADSIFTLYRVGAEARATERLCDEPKRVP
jgi:uncharacterized protein YdeI (BOF family)